MPLGFYLSLPLIAVLLWGGFFLVRRLMKSVDADYQKGTLEDVKKMDEARAKGADDRANGKSGLFDRMRDYQD